MTSNDENKNLKKITIYTDGSCIGNPGRGGWGAILMYTDTNGKLHKKKIRGDDSFTTNNRMELTAVIESLKNLKEKCNIDLYSDSKYVIEGITKWLLNWKKKKWKTSNKKPVQNQDLWQRLDEQVEKHNINFHWVKGHAYDELNNEVDELARNG